MNNYNEIIDYTYLKNFDISILHEALVIPIKTDGIYFKCFICEESDLNKLQINSLIRSIYLYKEEILFFLSDIKTRTKLYKLSINSTLETNIEEECIKEFFKLLMKKVVLLRCSDIHIEGMDNSMVIRFRIDGRLKVFYIFKKQFLKILSSYIKMLSKLDVTQHRIPMDGRFNLTIEDKKYDFRVSTMPTVYEESIVLRVLDNKNVKTHMESLGFSEHIHSEIKNIIKLNQGLVLIAGPTGSGKSTTLYSIISSLNKEDKKIITVEDPVEYKIEQIQQIQIREELDLSFDRILKNILRQDPDIILIGEIRDNKSLNIALQAALTGHLVLASIHANNSVETLSRLVDLKADEYLLSRTLKYIISQRLILKICQKCNKKGCVACNYTGFLGRSNIAEALKVDEKIIEIILNDGSDNITKYLNKMGFKTMLDDGLKKCDEGISTVKEIYKVINT